MVQWGSMGTRGYTPWQPRGTIHMGGWRMGVHSVTCLVLQAPETMGQLRYDR